MRYAKDVLDKIKMDKERDSTETIIEKSKGKLPASLIGGGIGLFISYSRGYSLFGGAIIGALAGGLIANYLIPSN